MVIKQMTEDELDRCEERIKAPPAGALWLTNQEQLRLVAEVRRLKERDVGLRKAAGRLIEKWRTMYGHAINAAGAKELAGEDGDLHIGIASACDMAADDLAKAMAEHD